MLDVEWTYETGDWLEFLKGMLPPLVGLGLNYQIRLQNSPKIVRVTLKQRNGGWQELSS